MEVLNRMDNTPQRVLYIVRTWVPDDMLDEWNDWHTNVHVAEVTAEPQVIRSWKYRVLEDTTPAEWAAQYVTVYEFASIGDYQAYSTGEAAARLRADYAERYGTAGKISRQVVQQEAALSNVP